MPLSSIPRPTPADYAPGFGTYISLVPDGNVVRFLAQQLKEILLLLTNLSEQDALIHHAPYTWSIKQVIGHIIDTERIFAYRALRIARNDPTPLASFEQDDYVKFADFDVVPLGELLEELTHVRESNRLLFQHVPQDAWLHRGVVNNHPATAAAFVYAIAGHTKHHLDILHKRLASPK